MTIRAAAPSDSGQQLPAVTVPSGRNTGSRVETFSRVVPARGESSALTTVPSARVTGVMSRSKKPEAMAASARCWERTPYSSWAWREVPRSSATFSAVWPIRMEGGSEERRVGKGWREEGEEWRGREDGRLEEQ